MVNNNLNKKEKIILGYLKTLTEPISVKKLSENISLSYQTTLKYCDILSAKGKINVKRIGTIKLITPIKNAR